MFHVFSQHFRRAVIGMVLSVSCFCSCTIDPASEENVSVLGNASQRVSSDALASMEAFGEQSELRILLHVDSICLAKDYYKTAPRKDSTIVIQAWLNPRLIKASVHGLGNNKLEGSLGREYYLIQKSYADGGSLDQAVAGMLALADSAFVSTKKSANWFRKLFQSNGFADLLDDATYSAMSHLVPTGGGGV